MNTEYKDRLGSNLLINNAFKGVNFETLEIGEIDLITVIQDLYESIVMF